MSLRTESTVLASIRTLLRRLPIDDKVPVLTLVS